MFLPLLVYLYIAMIGNDFSKKKLLNLFLLPFTIHVSYLFIKFTFANFYTLHINSIVFITNLFILSLYFLFGVKGIGDLKRIKRMIRKNNYSRYSFFFYVIMGYGIFLSLNSVIPYFIGNTSFENSFLYHSEDFFVVLATLINLWILVFAFIESPSLKQFIVSKNIYKSKENYSDTKAIDDFIEIVFIIEKQYKRPDFNLNTMLSYYNLKPNDFRAYVKAKKGVSVVEFINTYRIEAFKELLNEVDLKKFSLMGLANQVGYTSKATFYRNFKSIEGVTPKEFLDKKFDK